MSPQAMTDDQVANESELSSGDDMANAIGDTMNTTPSEPTSDKAKLPKGGVPSGASGAVYDVAIIGAGIVGLATALALTKRERPPRIIVLEAEDRVAAHQTGNNSGVIHSGLYYKPGSLKAKNCADGRDAMYQFCEEHGINHDKCGKVVVALDDAEIERLNVLEERGKANGLAGMRRIGPEELKELEPHVAGIAALHIPETGIVDYKEVSQVYRRLIEAAGGVVRTDATVKACHRRSNEMILETTIGPIKADHLINCGGLQSDRVARMCGMDPGLQIVPFRGEYYELVPDRQHLVKNLIYPVPDPRFPFLGVHFTRMVGGGIECGPNAVLAFKREGYSWSDFSLRDVFEMFTFPGFAHMAAKFWKTGFGEMHRSISKAAFVKALQRLMPELQESDVHPAGAGVRAQAVERDGSLVDDFRIVEDDRMVHVLNAPSPAATASLAIGEKIADLAVRDFHLK